ncbi:hypothetical protein N9N67_03210 [Bacteriovoracaceae bacterium]|nr:hypothetical protein [Bacteriovoracaceae bacterium]
MVIINIVLLLFILINSNKLLNSISLGALVSISIFQNSTNEFIPFFSFLAGLITFISCFIFKELKYDTKSYKKTSKGQQSLIIIVLVILSSLLALALSKIKINSNLINLSAVDMVSSIEFILIIFVLYMIALKKKKPVHD